MAVDLAGGMVEVSLDFTNSFVPDKERKEAKRKKSRKKIEKSRGRGMLRSGGWWR
jgi:hypothetical protein